MTDAGILREVVEGQLSFGDARDLVGASGGDLDTIWCGDFIDAVGCSVFAEIFIFERLWEFESFAPNGYF